MLLRYIKCVKPDRSALAGHELRQGLSVDRRGAKEALVEGAALAGEQSELLLALHALRDHLQPERARHVDHAAHDDPVARRAGNVLAQPLVDLQIIERQRLQISET